MQSTKTEKKKTETQAERKHKPALNFLLLSAGSIFTSMMVAGFIVGFVLDTLLDTKPIFILACAVLGFVGGSMKVNKLLEKMDLLVDYKAEKPSKGNQENAD